MTLGSDDLSGPEYACLELAWEALRRRSLPVGAVVTDAEGTVVATGRNRVFESAAPAPQIAGSRLAHAEVNALAQLSPRRRYEDHHLVVTLEPCTLCTGALAMSAVRRRQADVPRGRPLRRRHHRRRPDAVHRTAAGRDHRPAPGPDRPARGRAACGVLPAPGSGQPGRVGASRPAARPRRSRRGAGAGPHLRSFRTGPAVVRCRR